MNRPQRLLGIVLCGGQSSRMGHDKSLLAHPAGGNFLEFAVNRLAELCDEVCISGDPGQAVDASVIADPIQFRGPATGIASALRFAKQRAFDACLITPIDMPFVSRENLQGLVDQWQGSQRLTIAMSAKPQPLLGVYPVSLANQIHQIASSDNRSLSAWLKSQTYDSVTLTEATCRNINTPEDLADDT